MATTRQSRLVKDWKNFILRIVRRRWGDSVDYAVIERHLDKLLEKELVNPKAYWVNNFRRAVVATDAITALDSIDDSGLVIGGAGTTFLPHEAMRNPFRDFIIHGQQKRKKEKKTRDTFERGKDDNWDRYNIKQNNTKIVLNSLYGVLGYMKFIFHNIFLAESITRMGRVIISTAACGFENFLADNIRFSTTSELYEYIDNICTEYEEKYRGYDFSILGVAVDADKVVDRLVDKCGFAVSSATRAHILGMVGRQDASCKLMLYYKNNFFTFNRIPAIKAKIIKIVNGIDELKLPSLDKIKDPEIRDEVEDLWKFYDMFVFYNHPIYDSVRKMAYGSREAVLYIDTDSNFIALNRWVNQVKHEFLNDEIRQDYKEFVFICVSVITIFLSIVVDRNLKMLAKNMRISDKWATFLSMKNELFMWRILFSDVKKRYIDLQLLQEGKLLKEGRGLPEIKGYDFRKSVTKEYVRDYYTDMCTDKILKPDSINLRDIMGDLEALKREIRRSMEAGESTYFKQANVNSPEHYADPIRISGIKAVMLWNALVPDYPIELPSDVNIVPIKNLASQKVRDWFAQAYPDVYKRLEREIFNNRNPNIAKMSLTVIAKPKNQNIPIPPWLPELMDTSKVVNATIKLINPIMTSLGLKVQKVGTSKEFLTNIVDL